MKEMDTKKKAAKETKKIYVVGHRNPDTDSICSAIAYANLKNAAGTQLHVPCRAGQINEETQFILDKFGVEVPKLITSLKMQVRDVELHETESLPKEYSIKEAWEKMSELNMKTLPVLEDGRVEGVITVGDIAKSYMDVGDSRILANANTKYANIAKAVKGEIVTGDPSDVITKGKVAIAASDLELVSEFVEEDDLVIMGNRAQVQQQAIDLKVGCMLACNGASISDEIKAQAEKKGIVIIRTDCDTFTVARLINQSLPIEYAMTKENLISFRMTDYLDDIKEKMTNKKFRDFPVVDDDGRFLGFISRRRLLNSHKKRVILVDHNEKNQAVKGVEEAQVMEIIDHHRLNSIETISPVFFRNQPVGSTATIICGMYREQGVEIDKTNASLMCAAIISDTLMFRSPTCTDADVKAAEKLAGIAGIDMKELSEEMFRAGSDLADRTPEEILGMDFKKFTINKREIGIDQVNVMDDTEIEQIKESVQPYIEEMCDKKKVDMFFFMITNIMDESTHIICSSEEAADYITSAFEMDETDEKILKLKGIVSRKKQFVPAIISAMQ